MKDSRGEKLVAALRGTLTREATVEALVAAVHGCIDADCRQALKIRAAVLVYAEDCARNQASWLLPLMPGEVTP